jgi:hypothetical protein
MSETLQPWYAVATPHEDISEGKYRIVFTNHSRKTGEVRPRPRFERYRNNFEMLQDYRD